MRCSALMVAQTVAGDTELEVWVQGSYAGRLFQQDTGVTFTYDEAYRRARTPALSVSMPKSRARHDAQVASRWIDNLLPDNDSVRERWAAAFGERRVTAFNLLRHMGADCAGAVQVMPVGTSPESDAGSEQVTEDDIEQRLRALRQDDTEWNFKDHGGRWSLGGAQGKFALARTADGTWVEPTGRAASTHIFKVGVQRFPHGDAAEFVTMRAAQLLGLPVAVTELRRFGAETAMISQRYDRQADQDGTVRRLHQEDLCQALGLSRALKYQSDGGPSVQTISELLTEKVDPRDLLASREMFAQALVYNWLTAGTDAHAKNYSLLHVGARVRLAPLYDLTSAAMLLPAKEVHYEGKLAMKLGGEYGIRGIETRHLMRTAHTLELEPEWLLSTAQRFTDALPDAVEQAMNQVPSAMSSQTRASFRTGIRARVDLARQTLATDGTTPAASTQPTAKDPTSATSGSIWVEPHSREGRPVDGYWRNRSGR
jgi:serine/threonine-protein kinase HipA